MQISRAEIEGKHVGIKAKVNEHLGKLKRLEEREASKAKFDDPKYTSIMDTIPPRENQDKIPLTVHLIATTHTDLGWDNTFMELFDGAMNGL